MNFHTHTIQQKSNVFFFVIYKPLNHIFVKNIFFKKTKISISIQKTFIEIIFNIFLVQVKNYKYLQIFKNGVKMKLKTLI